jgi:hypothetical protein
MKSDDKKKKPYAQPALTELSRSQAIKVVAQRNNWSEEEAAKFVDSLKSPLRQNEANSRKESDGRDQGRKRA